MSHTAVQQQSEQTALQIAGTALHGLGTEVFDMTEMSFVETVPM
jgi:hypothetical protein